MLYVTHPLDQISVAQGFVGIPFSHKTVVRTGVYAGILKRDFLTDLQYMLHCLTALINRVSQSFHQHY